MLVTSDTSQSSIGPYVATTVLFDAPPAIQSDTTFLNPPGDECDSSPFGNLSNPCTTANPPNNNSNNMGRSGHPSLFFNVRRRLPAAARTRFPKAIVFFFFRARPKTDGAPYNRFVTVRVHPPLERRVRPPDAKEHIHLEL